MRENILPVSLPNSETPEHEFRLEKRSTNAESDEAKGNSKLSGPAIAGIIVFTVVLLSAIIMFFFYRRRKSESGKNYRPQSSPHAVKHNPISLQTSTFQLTSHSSPKPIPAAPDYQALGIGRRSSAREMINDSSSSEEEQYFDADEVLEKYDWSSPQRRKKKAAANKDDAASVRKNAEIVREDKVDANPEEERINYPPGHTGRIWFCVDYKASTEKLAVTIFKVRNLPTRDNSSCAPDPLVRLYLLPDERCQHQTEAKRNTRNPNFGRSFNFQVARAHLPQRVLRLSVYDQGKGRRSDVIGHVLYSLKDQVFGIKTWRDLETLSEVESKLGDLHVSLAHYPVLDRLTVIILRGANLPLPKDKNDPDTYVKVTFSKGNNVLKVKKTGVKHNTTEPFYNESFNIATTMDDLPSCSLLLSVYQCTGNEDEGQEGKLIGRVLLGGMMYARGKELEHWNKMICQPRTMVKYWHSLVK